MTDNRVGKVYETVQIGDLKWLRGNLGYETVLSYCPNLNKKKHPCEQGNFYSYLELDTICPAGWRLPSSTDWQNYFDFLRISKGGYGAAIPFKAITLSLMKALLHLFHTQFRKRSMVGYLWTSV